MKNIIIITRVLNGVCVSSPLANCCAEVATQFCGSFPKAGLALNSTESNRTEVFPVHKQPYALEAVVS